MAVQIFTNKNAYLEFVPIGKEIRLTKMYIFYFEKFVTLIEIQEKYVYI